MIGTKSASSALLALAAAGPGCGDASAAQAQWLVFVDTNAVLAAQALARPELSADAVIDTIRVDALAPDGSLLDTRAFAVADPSALPLSFGFAASDDGGSRLRLRAFRGAAAEVGPGAGAATLEPPLEVTVDRLVALGAPDGVARVSVVLDMECLGRPVSFLGAGSTCIDAARPSAAASDGFLLLGSAAPPATLAGTWARALEIPCGADPDTSRLCVPGGFSLLGDLALAEVGNPQRLASTPLVPVVSSPFVMDRTEYTVGRLRGVLGSLAPSERPLVHDPSDPIARDCTWPGDGVAGSDDLPVNCLARELAEHLCEMDQGQLPTEAQWEHAARGRGAGRRYPWGDRDVTCCMASASRGGPPASPAECSGDGVESVGSHTGPQLCDHVGDVSRDGILDLAGSVAEATRDSFRPYDTACWAGTILTDPVCDDPSTSKHVARGGTWNDALERTRSALRGLWVDDVPTMGFRCVYPAP